MSDVIISGEYAVRTFRLANICEESVNHSHHYDHITRVIRGRVRLTKSYERDGVRFEGEPEEYSAGEEFLVKAEVWHTIKALTPDVKYECRFPHRDWDGNVIPTYIGNVHGHT